MITDFINLLVIVRFQDRVVQFGFSFGNMTTVPKI